MGGGRGFLHRALRAAPVVMALVAMLGLCAWGAAALWYQVPGGFLIKAVAAALWVAVSLGAIVLLFYRRAIAVTAYAALSALLLVWWVAIAPSNDRDWADEVARMTAGTVSGDIVTLSNVRDFDWRTATDYTPHWETRTYDLRTLSSVDLILSYWTGPAIAHTLVSFGFDDGSYVTFSVEIRKERHEAFSTVGGFFKQFETSVVAADERDIVRLRTNVRAEDVYLFRIDMPEPAMRSLFLSYVEEANALVEKPRFYHTVTANCTTIVYEMVSRIVPGLPLDYRLLFSGYLPEYIETVDGFTPGFSAAALREAGAISVRGQSAGGSTDFSTLIRAGIPGIADPPPRE